MNYPKPNNFSEVAVYVKAPTYISVPLYKHKIRAKNGKGSIVSEETQGIGGGVTRNALMFGIGILAAVAVAYYIYKRIKK